MKPSRRLARGRAINRSEAQSSSHASEAGRKHTSRLGATGWGRAGLPAAAHRHGVLLECSEGCPQTPVPAWTHRVPRGRLISDNPMRNATCCISAGVTTAWGQHRASCPPLLPFSLPTEPVPTQPQVPMGSLPCSSQPRLHPSQPPRGAPIHQRPRQEPPA